MLGLSLNLTQTVFTRLTQPVAPLHWRCKYSIWQIGLKARTMRNFACALIMVWDGQPGYPIKTNKHNDNENRGLTSSQYNSGI